MPLKNISLTKEDFEQLSWEDVLEQAEARSCHYYSKLLFAKAEEASKNRDEQAQEAYSLLGAVSSFVLKLDTVDGPFYPPFVLGTSRGYIPDDIPDHHMDVLNEIVPSIKDAEMRARVADVLWVTRDDYRMAQLAITSYLQAAPLLEGMKTWEECLDRMERALDLAAKLSKKEPLYQNVINYFEAFLDKVSPSTAPCHAISRTMELLQQHGQGDFVKCAEQAEAVALKAEGASEWFVAERLWRVKARWHALNGDEESESKALIASAETYTKYTEELLKQDPPNYPIAQANLQWAIEGLRRVGGMQNRIDELHKRMLEYQEKAASNMGAISVSINLAEPAEQARRIIEGKTLYDALFTLATLGASPSITQLRKAVEDRIRDYPLQFAIHARSITEQGKVTATRPSMITDKLSEQEQVIRAEMLRLACLQQEIFAEGVVRPAVTQINLEHNVRVADILPIVTNNPFVPPGREYLYAQGLTAGMQGYFVFATHLLLPQIEHSIRYLLYRRGVITSKLTSDGIQDEFDLNRMLYMPEVKEIFGEDLVFNLQGLLIERFGTNLRNRVAHGLLDYEAFFSLRVVYLWWLTLRLCFLPIIAQTSLTNTG